MRSLLRAVRMWLGAEHLGAPGWLLALALAVVLAAGALLGVRTLGPGVPPTRPAHPTAAFIGDSYTQGVGASGSADRWSTVLATAEGWREENLGRGGTGYVATADVTGCGLQFCPNFVSMVQRAVDTNPDIVVVSGGQNDFSAWSQDGRQVRAAITQVYAQLRRSLPAAEIYAVGPSTTGTVEGPVVQMDAAVRSAAEQNHAHYVSLIRPDVITSAMVLPDGGHVDDEGHAAIAQRVLRAVRAVDAR